MQTESSIDFSSKYKYCEYVPAGEHYFYFVNKNNKYCLSQNYEIVQFPGTTLRMNMIRVEEQQSDDMNLVKYRENNNKDHN